MWVLVGAFEDTYFHFFELFFRMIFMSGLVITVPTTSILRPMQTHTMPKEASSLLILDGCWFVNTQMSLKKGKSWTFVI